MLERKATRRFSLRNEGDKAAREVGVSLRPNSQLEGIRVGPEEKTLQVDSFTEIIQIEDVLPGELEERSIPVVATSSLPSEALRLDVSVNATGQATLESPDQGTIPAGETLDQLVDEQIPRTDMERPDAIAVVIGIKEYQNQDIPDVDYALRDARTMRKYLTRTLGFREENVIFAENASGSKLREIFGMGDNPRAHLYNLVKPGKSDVFVYYSGHRALDEAYLVAANTNPNYLSINGYPAGKLYENLTQVPVRSTTVVLEACFTGVLEVGAVVQRASPVELSVENPVLAMENGLAFTAEAADQIASWHTEKEHGLFTYFFLKGLRGEADQNGDGTTTASELEVYLTDRVPYRGPANVQPRADAAGGRAGQRSGAGGVRVIVNV